MSLPVDCQLPCHANRELAIVLSKSSFHNGMLESCAFGVHVQVRALSLSQGGAPGSRARWSADGHFAFGLVLQTKL